MSLMPPIDFRKLSITISGTFSDEKKSRSSESLCSTELTPKACRTIPSLATRGEEKEVVYVVKHEYNKKNVTGKLYIFY